MCNCSGPRTLEAPRFHDFNLQVYCVKSSTASVPVSIGGSRVGPGGSMAQLEIVHNVSV